MTVFIVLLAAALLFTAVLFHFSSRSDKFERYERAALAAQAIVTCVALLSAGWWYFVERKGMPHADVSLRVTAVKLDEARLLVEARLAVRNLGTTLLEVGGADFRYQPLAPDALRLDEIESLERSAFPGFEDGGQYQNGVLQWNVTRNYVDREHTLELEPGERDLRHVDFIANCRHPAARVTASMEKPGDEDGRVWRDRALVSFVELCRGGAAVGTRRVLNGENDDDDSA